MLCVLRLAWCVVVAAAALRFVSSDSTGASSHLQQHVSPNHLNIDDGED